MSIDIIGLSLNLIGTIVAGLSGGMYLKLVNASLTAHQLFIETYTNKQSNVVVFTGLEKHRESALKNALIGTTIGLILIVIGFALQLLDFVLKT
jgi:hypothetical protein